MLDILRITIWFLIAQWVAGFIHVQYTRIQDQEWFYQLFLILTY